MSDPVATAAAAVRDATTTAETYTPLMPLADLAAEWFEEHVFSILGSADGATNAHLLNITMGLETVDSDVASVSVDSDDNTCHSETYTPLMPLADLAAEWVEEQRLKPHVAAIHQGLEIKWASIKEEPLMADASLVKGYGGY
jgi:hypothetical protein